MPDPLNGDALTIPVYTYGYDAFGNQTLLIDPLGRETRWTFDDHGRQTSRMLPLHFGADGIQGTTDDNMASDFSESFEYDERGRQFLHISFEGVVTASVFDDLTGRLTEKRFFDNQADYNTGSPAEVWSCTYDLLSSPCVDGVLEDDRS